MSATDPFIRVAVITGKPLPDHNAPTPNKALSVSDTASVDPSADKSGPIIKAIVLSQQSCQVQDTYCAIVPDDKEAIETLVVKWCSSGSVDWIITTGGTGFGVRDVTPEVSYHPIRSCVSIAHELTNKSGNSSHYRTSCSRIGPSHALFVLEANTFSRSFETRSWDHPKHSDHDITWQPQSREGELRSFVSSWVD